MFLDRYRKLAGFLSGFGGRLFEQESFRMACMQYIKLSSSIFTVLCLSRLVKPDVAAQYFRLANFWNPVAALALPPLPVWGACALCCASFPPPAFLQVGKQKCFLTAACYRRRAVGKVLFSNLSNTWLKVFLTSSSGIAEFIVTWVQNNCCIIK